MTDRNIMPKASPVALFTVLSNETKLFAQNGKTCNEMNTGRTTPLISNEAGKSVPA